MASTSSHQVRPPKSVGRAEPESAPVSGSPGQDGQVTGATSNSTRARGGRVLAAERWLLRQLLRRLGSPAIRVALWDGEPIAVSNAPPIAVVRIHDRRTLLELMVQREKDSGVGLRCAFVLS